MTIHRRLALALLLLLCMARPLQAQATPASATPEQIGLWLGGNDLRMVAWGATFALQTRTPESRPYLVALAGAWQTLPSRRTADGHERTLSPAEVDRSVAMGAVLDAMIQLRIPVDAAAVLRLAPDFPNQAVTLFALLPQDARHALASQVYAARKADEEYSQNKDYSGGMMVHLAAAILTQDRTPGLATSLITDMHATMRFTVVDAGRSSGYSNGLSGGLCGDFADAGPRPDWPRVMSYVVERGASQVPDRDAIVLVPGDRPITARRARTNSSCSYFGYLTDGERQDLVAQMAGVPVVQLGWSLTNSDTIRYTNDVEYVHEAGHVVEEIFDRVSFTEKALMNRQWMTLDETKHSLPSMVVTVEDRRTVKSPPLPDLVFESPRTTVQSTPTPPPAANP